MQNSASGSGPRIAIFVDAETVSAADWPAIGAVFAGLGGTVSLTCFADVANTAHADWLSVCRDTGGTLVGVQDAGRTNGADIALTVAVMETLMADGAEMYVIVSSDGDFAPLANRITSAGRIAVGIGHDTAHPDLRAAFSRFAVLPRRASAPEPEAEEPTGASHHAAQAQADGPTVTPEQKEELVALITHLSREDDSGSVLLSRLGLALKHDNPALAATLARGELRKAIARFDLGTEHGEGTAIRISPRKAATARHAPEIEWRHAG